MKRKVRLGIGMIILFGIVGIIIVNNVLPYLIIRPPRVVAGIGPNDFGLASEKLSVTAVDDAELVGYWVKTSEDSAKGVIILVHGIGGCKEGFLEVSEKLAKDGIESIVFDNRAHGESGGAFCTYGFKEKTDISKIVDKIKERDVSMPIGIWGNSLGGAIALQALEIDERIEFGIIESTFTELDKIVFDYKKRILKGLGFKRLSDFLLKRAGKIADFDPQMVKPVDSVKKIEQSILLAHGAIDKNISVNYGKELFENLKSENKELVIIEGGGHFDLYEKGGREYMLKIDDFINQHLK